MKEKVVIYWARRDLRLSDNPALSAAVAYAKKEEAHLLPLYIVEDYMTAGDASEQFGYPSRVFLSRALPRFAAQFPDFVTLCGKGAQTLIALGEKYELMIFVNEDIHHDFYTQIKKIAAAGVTIKLYADALTVSKDTKTGMGKIYSVFTPFKNAVWAEFCSKAVLPAPSFEGVSWFSSSARGLSESVVECTEKQLREVFGTTKRFTVGGVVYDRDEILSVQSSYDEWYTDEAGVLECFDKFVTTTLTDYKKKRDYLDTEGTSRMSVALAWGLVSARILREKIDQHYRTSFPRLPVAEHLEGPTHYISELIWREFYKYLLYQYPELLDTEFQEKFRGTVEWVDDATAHARFTAWVQGKTGYPIVDAAMMQLAKTGYMHNRTRMVVASILTKNFGVDWRWGQEYFRAMLIDLDEASNSGGWQWGASVGADPKPIRIFNPYLQAEHYDPKGVYQNHWLDASYREHPPTPIVPHVDARAEALKRYKLSESIQPRFY